MSMHFSSGRRRARAILALIALVAGMQGCLVTSSNTTTESGIRVSEATLSQVEPGRTTEAWLIALLGEPSSRVAVKDRPGQEILRYDFSRVEASGGSVFLIFGGSSRRETNQRVFFEVTDGVVTRHWQES